MRKVQAGLKARAVSVASLSQQTREDMFTVFEKYYSNVTFAEFDRDLNNKNDVIILREKATNSVKGFSTIKIMDMDVDGRKVKGIFSGDTIVEKEFWGGSAMHFEFARYFILKRLKNPFTPFYWFLISKGYKTYLLLTNNFVNYYPRFDRETPVTMSNLIASFATKLYPDYYEPDSGLIRFPYVSAHLKSHVAAIDEHLLATNPKIAFFAQKNPEWAKGTELCCVGELSWNLPALYLAKFVRKKLKPTARVRDLDFIETPAKIVVSDQTAKIQETDRKADLTL